MAAETRGVFTLKTVRNNILNDEYVTPDQAFFSDLRGFDTGYFGGGNPGPLSTMDRTTYSTDTTTVVPGAALSVARYGLAATGSQSAGYFGGGATVSTMDKLSYSTETTAVVPGAALSIARFSFAATGNERFGYFAGGLLYPPIYSTVDKLTYSTDTTAATPSAALTSARYNFAATGTALGFNSGYFCGGTTGAPVLSAINKLNFSSETTSTIPATMSAARYQPTGTGSGFAGYIGGGGPLTSAVDKLAYNNETLARIPSANLSSARQAQGATASQTSGYFGGGNPGPVSTMDKVTYSTDTTAATPGANLSVARVSLAAASSRANALPTSTTPQNLKGQPNPPDFGYFVGGPFNPSGTEKVTFTTDTASQVRSAQLQVGRQAQGSGSSQSAAYYLAGASVTAVDKISYSTETAVLVPGANFVYAQGYVGSVQSKNAAYLGTGQGPGAPYRSWVQKMTFTTETSTVLTNSLSRTNAFAAGVGDGTNGYFVGGDTNISTTDKLNFSTETINQPTSANITPARGYIAGSGDDKAGYIAAGESPVVSYINKLTYAVDVNSILPGANTTRSIGEGHQTGNFTNGYFTSGYDGGSYRTDTDKINYASNTAFRAPTACLATGNRYMTGVSGRDRNMTQTQIATPTLNSSIPGSVPNTGYIAGGVEVPGPLRSDFNKLNFATDTVQYLPSTTLSGARYRHNGSASSSAGYFGGGRVSGGPRISTMDKLTFSTDSCVAVPGAALREATYGAVTATSTTFGYFAGGAPGGPYRSATDKLTFSSDTTATVPSAQLNQGLAMSEGGSASPSSAYLGGSVDIPGTPLSSVAKITFSNDTRTEVPSAALIASKYSQAAGHNTTHAYFTGGNPGPVSITSKLTFATETTQQSANYPITIYEHSASGNATAGYFSNGNNPAPNIISDIYKLDYTTETFGLMASMSPSLGNSVAASLSAREGGASYTSNIL